MARLRSEPSGPSGTDLTVISGQGILIARFAAYVDGHVGRPRGDLNLRLGVPFDQIPNVLPLMREIGGIRFEVTVRRVPAEDLPPPAWQ